MALEEIGFSVRSVTNVLSKITKIKLPLFFIDLEPAKINNNIFERNYLLNTKIKIEEPYKQRTIVQCQNCQNYGHSKAYCSYPPRCVRCAVQHLTSTCTKLWDTPVKCVLCNGDHPANYRGCQIHKNQQKLRLPNSRTQQLHTIKTQKNQHILTTAPQAETH